MVSRIGGGGQPRCAIKSPPSSPLPDLPAWGSCYRRSAHATAVLAGTRAMRPPRAAVRQRSIADMTLSCARAQVSGMGGLDKRSRRHGRCQGLRQGAHRLRRWVRPLRPGTSRACRAGWLRCTRSGRDLVKAVFSSFACPSSMTRISTPSSSRWVAKLRSVRGPTFLVRGVYSLDDDAMELPGADWLHGVLSRKQPTVAMHHACWCPTPVRAAG